MTIRKMRAALCAALVLFGYGSSAFAQDVTLSARDGTLSVSGTLRGYDGEFFRLDSDYGLLTVDAEGVVCTGPGCPELIVPVAELALIADPLLGARLLPDLIAAFAKDRELTLSLDMAATGQPVYVLNDRSRPEPVARIATTLQPATDTPSAFLTTQGDTDPGQRARARVLGAEAFVPFVSADNPVDRIGFSDLRAVVSGEIDNWNLLGGPDAPIRLHRLAPGGLQDRIEAQLGSGTAEWAVPHGTPADLARAVARDPFAFGITAYSETEIGKTLLLTGSCGFDQRVTPFAIKAEDYPLQLPMLLYTPAHRLPAFARDLLGYLASPEAEAVIRANGLTDAGLSRQGIEAQGRRLGNAIRAAGADISLTELQRLAEALNGAARLSTTFRFEEGSSRLDAQSVGNLTELTVAIEAGLAGVGRVIFAGFSDGQGNADENRRLSRKRAEAVRNEVRAALRLPRGSGPVLEAEGYGAALPMACDEDPAGRQINRRVEVWIVPG